MQNVIPSIRINLWTGRVVIQQHEVADFITDIFVGPDTTPRRRLG